MQTPDHRFVKPACLQSVFWRFLSCSNEYASGKCIGVKVKVDRSIKTQVKYRFSPPKNTKVWKRSIITLLHYTADEIWDITFISAFLLFAVQLCFFFFFLIYTAVLFCTSKMYSICFDLSSSAEVFVPHIDLDTDERLTCIRESFYKTAFAVLYWFSLAVHGCAWNRKCFHVENVSKFRACFTRIALNFEVSLCVCACGCVYISGF